jgi:sugar transferase (PEP-CTERM/EpsH1 system associated)
VARERANAPADAVRSVVQVVQSIDKGGLETMAANLAIDLAARGFRSTIVSLEDGGFLEGRLRDGGVEVHVLGDGRWRNPRTHLQLTRIFRDAGADVVHTHHLPCLLTSVAARTAAGVKQLVHTEHAFQYLEPAPAWRAAFRAASLATSAVVVVGHEMADYYRDVVGVAPRRLRVIPNGIDTERHHPHADVTALRRSLGLPDGLLVGTAGRFATVKNFPLLLRASARARTARPELRLVMVGDGTERPAMEALARDLGFEDAVHFLGWRSDVADILGALDLFALTSISEGLPLVVLEAMACGIPAVTTAVGDLPALITDGETGYTFPSGDEDALTALLVRLAAAPNERRAMGARARDVVLAGYSQRGMVDAYLDAYGVAQRSSSPDA